MTDLGGPPLTQCAVTLWGVCPACLGIALAPSSGDAVRCPSCLQAWPLAERVPCPEAASFAMINVGGDRHLICRSHAVGAAIIIDEIKLEPLWPDVAPLTRATLMAAAVHRYPAAVPPLATNANEQQRDEYQNSVDRRERRVEELHRHVDRHATTTAEARPPGKVLRFERPK